ncbi:hypothetical protein EJ07DRAFT_129666 [Lizonia empirigonia]|nr:hypothetical protein EJ07DRAFT_129666 [Lizonia empirigonia]
MQVTGSSQDARSSQEARSNFPIQPAADSGTFKLKKKAVKIVGAAGSAAGAPLSQPSSRLVAPVSKPTMTSLSTPVSPPAPGLVKVQQTVIEIELPPRSHATKSSLDDMFARLLGASSNVSLRPVENLLPAGPETSKLSSEDDLEVNAATTYVSGNSTPSNDQVRLGHIHEKSSWPQSSLKTSQAPRSTVQQDVSQDELEQEYLCKAAEYISALPGNANASVNMIQAVSRKLRISYASEAAKLQTGEFEKLRARYAFAVVKYVNEKVKLNPEPLPAEFVKRSLHDGNGDILRLCAALVEGKYIALDSLEQVTGLCKNILDVLPKTDGAPTAQPNAFSVGTSNSSLVASASSPTTAAKEKAADPLDGMKAWPTQEKREHGALYRSCVLKGVAGIKSLNELQALVWGGRLESISIPEAGSENSVVKFLTPEACQAYLEATENGIEVQGGTKKTIVFVHKQPGPNSINDVIQNCIDGDASRCIRATGADDDWSDGALLKLARGKQQIQRDVDRIKQGKTAHGHHYIEFRFGNIYHALNFKRYLMRDEEWEHCSIGYAPDPCELARGMHHKDADEEDSGLFD